MKMGLMLATAVASASVLISALGAGPVAAEQLARTAVMKPGAGASFDVGAQHAISYFKAVKGACNLTVVVANRATADDEVTAAGQRMNMSLLPGRSARVDTADGKSLEFVCGAAAQAMTVRVLERTATVPASTVR